MSSEPGGLGFGTITTEPFTESDVFGVVGGVGTVGGRMGTAVAVPSATRSTTNNRESVEYVMACELT